MKNSKKKVMENSESDFKHSAYESIWKMIHCEYS